MDALQEYEKLLLSAPSPDGAQILAPALSSLPHQGQLVTGPTLGDYKNGQPVTATIAEQQKNGVRGFGLGEQHENVGFIKAVSSQFFELKKQGITTLYVEYLPAEKMGLLNKALNGDETSQKMVRAELERGFGYTTDSAQARYDAMVIAHKAGMRVIPFNTPGTQSQISHNYADEPGGNGAAAGSRLQTGDPYISRTIKQHDDGQGFIFLVGEAHTYAADVQDKLNHYPEKFGLTPSAFGGTDARLNALGIKTVSIDYNLDETGPAAVKKGNGIDNDFKLTLPADLENKTPENMALSLQGRMFQMNDKLKYISDGFNRDYAKSRSMAADSEKARSDLLAVANLWQQQSAEQSLQAAYKKFQESSVKVIARMDPDQQAEMGFHMRTLEKWIGADKIGDLSKDQQALQGSSGKRLWSGPGDEELTRLKAYAFVANLQSATAPIAASVVQPTLPRPASLTEPAH